jgi:hypothetical protein
MENLPANAPAHLKRAHDAVTKIAVIEGRENASVAWDEYCRAQDGPFSGKRAPIKLAMRTTEKLGIYGDPASQKPFGVETTVLETYLDPRSPADSLVRAIQWIVESKRLTWEIKSRNQRPTLAGEKFAERTQSDQPWTSVNMGPYFLTGVTAPELKTAVDSLELPLKLTLRHTNDKSGGVPPSTCADVSAFAIDCLFKGKLTMLAYASLKNQHQHWVLGVGVEGLGVPSKQTVDSLLVLDPADCLQPYAVANGWLRRAIGAKQRQAGHWMYEGPGFSSEPVRLISAVCMELRV